MHWAEQYIGKPWVNGARGPEQFDCWGLLWWIYARHLGIMLPLYPVDAKDVTTVRQLFEAQSQGLADSHWRRLETPCDLCAVAIGCGGKFSHVGIYLEVDGGLVLHCADGHNVVAQKASALRAYLKLEFFKWQPL